MPNSGLLELNGKDLTVVIDEETAEKAPLASPALTGTATLNGQTIATVNQIPDTSGFLSTSGGTVSGNLTVSGTITGFLNGNASSANYATTAGRATDATKIAISGSRGKLAGYETCVTSNLLTLNASSADSNDFNSTSVITVNDGTAGTCWTKTIKLSQVPSAVNFGSNWNWVGGSAPTMVVNGLLVCTWQNNHGLINFLSPSA